MWLIKATPLALKKLGIETIDDKLWGLDFTGDLTLVKYHYHKNFLLRKGFVDVSPKWMIEERKSRNLERILIICFGGYGDLIFLTPAIKALSKQNIDVTVITYRAGREVFKNNPAVKTTIDCLYHEIGLYIDQYDQVYDLTHSIEYNPESEYLNVYDITNKILDIKPEKNKPELFLSQDEISWGKLELERLKVSTQDKTVLIQGESSSEYRNWPINNTVTLANLLSRDGYKVIVVSEKLTQKDLRKNIAFINSYYDSIRKIFSLIAQPQVKLVIGPDSSFIHTAEALNKDSLGLYGSFDPYTRVKDYEKCQVVISDYNCRFCNLHGNDASKCLNKIHIGCMKSIKPQTVWSAARNVLKSQDEKVETSRRKYLEQIGHFESFMAGRDWDSQSKTAQNIYKARLRNLERKAKG